MKAQGLESAMQARADCGWEWSPQKQRKPGQPYTVSRLMVTQRYFSEWICVAPEGYYIIVWIMVRVCLSTKRLIGGCHASARRSIYASSLKIVAGYRQPPRAIRRRHHGASPLGDCLRAWFRRKPGVLRPIVVGVRGQ